MLDTLPAEYDSRVKAMEVDEKPTEKYTDVGGLDKQIEELVEAIVWPMKEADRFKKIGIKAPKGMQNARYGRRSVHTNTSQVPSCMDLLVPARLSSRELALLKQTPLS